MANKKDEQIIAELRAKIAELEVKKKLTGKEKDDLNFYKTNLRVLTDPEFRKSLEKVEADIAAGNVVSLDDLEAHLRKRKK